MEYFTAHWYHLSGNDEPRTFYSEIDHKRFEQRKIEIFDDGSFGMAGNGFSFGGTDLGDVPIPSIEEINGDTEFSAGLITADEFEAVWAKYRDYLK